MSPRKVPAVLCHILMERGFFQQTVENSLNNRLQENPSSGSRDIAWGLTDMKKLLVAIRNFASASKNVLGSVTNWEP
jgi:hypothetical protein